MKETVTERVLPKKTVIHLNGSKSYDKKGKIVAYRWSVISGNATIINPDSMVTKAIVYRKGTYIFQLWGKNNFGLTAKDTTIKKVVIR